MIFCCQVCKLLKICDGGQGNGTVVSGSVCEAGRPGSCPARSTCFRKLEFYQNAIDLFPPVLTTGSTKAVHVLSCLCDNACKRFLAICRKSSCVLLAGYCLSRYGLHVLNRDVNMIQTNKQTNKSKSGTGITETY